jgi:hypothetical protein
MDDMQELTINGDLGEQLRAAKGWVRLVDEAGNILGNFKPRDVAPYDPAVIPPTPIEEIKRRAREFSGGRTLDEILSDLQERT